MPITEQDIKLYKSSVMLDVPDGGGPMSGQVVPDGISNNLYPDTSEIDRSRGRVQFRSVFGVAETPDTDTLLGTHALITSPPADPLVHAALIKPAKWGGTVTDYKGQVERYLLKGVRVTSRLLDVHYAGSVALQLISMSGTDFPSANEVVVLVNPDVLVPDQYVRVVKITKRQQEFTVYEGAVVTFNAWVATAELANPLVADQPGPPVSRAVAEEAPFTKLYSTTRASGASFYSLRPLAAPATTGSLSATVDTVYHPIVPAAQVETPLVDIAPYQAVVAVARTGLSFVTLPTATVTPTAGFVWRMPTAVEAGSLQIVHGGTVLTDYLGALRDGTTVVGTVDYVTGTAALSSSAPAYGSAGSTITYKPGTRASGVMHSRDVAITTSNSGLAWVQDLEPKPMPGSISIDYMAQGAWYTLTDTGGTGKLAGASSAHGVGTVNYGTGSIAVTLGAIPDTDSSILYAWATADSSKPVDGPFPTAASTNGTLAVAGDSSAYAVPDTLAWTVLGQPRSATVTGGVVSGGATGKAYGTYLSDFAPAEVPDVGSLTWTGSKYLPPVSGTVPAPASGMSIDLGHTNLSGINGRAKVSLTPSGGNWAFDPGIDVTITSNAVIAATWGTVIGVVDPAAGTITLNPTVTLPSVRATAQQTGVLAGAVVNNYYSYATDVDAVCTINGFTAPGAALEIAYWSVGTTTPGASGTGVLESAWTVLPSTPAVSSAAPAQDTSVAISVFDTLLTVAGAPRLGWNVGTGSPTTPSAGTFEASIGRITIDSPPPGKSTAMVVHNIAARRSDVFLTSGVFRTQTAPLKPGSMQLSSNSLTASVDSAGVITGDFEGRVDFSRGIVRWQRTGQSSPSFSAAWGAYTTAVVEGATPDSFAYNAVFMQYLPLDAALLGLDTSRLPLDGRVPYVRTGDTAVVHHTLATTMPNPVTLGAVQSLGRTRIATVKVLDAAGAKVPSTLYATDLDAGTITFTASLALYAQPLTVHHRIEDVMLVSQVDISGAVAFTRPLTHTFPAGESYLSSALLAGDVQARAYGQYEQEAWTGEWTDTATGVAVLANYNEVASPIGVTNAGAIPERWACIFTNSTTFRVVGESVGEIATGDINTRTAPVNPATMAPYFTIEAAGWGTGWSAGNVMRFNTDAAGANFVVVRTVLQGPATVASDKFEIAFRGDVNA